MAVCHGDDQDIGETWTPRQNVQVPDCGNKGSVVTALGGDLILSTAASCVNRVNLTVFVSKARGTPGSFVYRQHISDSAGYNTLAAMGSSGMVALLFEQEWALDPSASGDPAGSHAVAGAGSISLAIVDTTKIPKRGTIPCADSLCETSSGAHGWMPPPPPSSVNASVGYCRGPPPPPRPPAPDTPAGRACQAILDAFCNTPNNNSDCFTMTANISGEVYVVPPYHAVYGRASGSDEALAFRCYSHLALAGPARGRAGPPWHWSADGPTHGHPYCTNPGFGGKGSGALQKICATCTAPPPGLPADVKCVPAGGGGGLTGKPSPHR